MWLLNDSEKNRKLSRSSLTVVKLDERVWSRYKKLAKWTYSDWSIETIDPDRREIMRQIELNKILLI